MLWVFSFENELIHNGIKSTHSSSFLQIHVWVSDSLDSILSELDGETFDICQVAPNEFQRNSMSAVVGQQVSVRKWQKTNCYIYISPYHMLLCYIYSFVNACGKYNNYSLPVLRTMSWTVSKSYSVWPLDVNLPKHEVLMPHVPNQKHWNNVWVFTDRAREDL